jgi:alpha-mannosidase
MLNQEWRERLASWITEMPRHFYTPMIQLDVEAFVTTEQLTPDEAAGREFAAMQVGTAWGAQWEYGWFRLEVQLDERFKGMCAYLQYGFGAKGVLIYRDGELLGQRDMRDDKLCLVEKARGDERFSLLAEAYAGPSGGTPCHAGPTPPGRIVHPIGPTQQTLGATTVGAFCEEAYQLWCDTRCLLELRDQLHPDSLRVAKIDQALREMTLVVDFELPDAQARIESFQRGRQVLRGALECKNGSVAPELLGFGHAHLDVAWLWPLAETDRKAARTLSNQLRMIEGYPDYRFLHSQAYLFEVVKQKYPRLYQRVKKAVAHGRIIAEGGSYVEMDTNISSGESLIRQFLVGKAFFREEFDVDCRMLWLPDVFGYTAALPQILRGCGIDYFATAKIYWNYHGGDDFPRTVFRWQGIDGTDVGVHLMHDYNSQTSPTHLINRWRQRPEKEGFDARLLPFGWGDGGGGPERDHLEFVARARDLQGCPRVKHASPLDYFRHQDQQGWPEDPYVGELYFQAHRGVFTSQAKTKKGNRKGELALREAEMWSAVASARKAARLDTGDVDEAWRQLLLLQFHDILPGSSIGRVYEEAEALYERIASTADEARGRAQASLTDEGEAVTIFNSLNWDRYALIELPDGWAGVIDSEGDALCCQDIEGRRFVDPILPALGWTTLTRAESPRLPCGDGTQVDGGDNWLENQYLRLEVDDRGRIERLLDKQTGRELQVGPLNEMRMYRDVPSKFDAWDIDSMYAKTPVALEEPAEVELIASGGLAGVLRVKRKLHNSEMIQDIRLKRRSRRIDFVTRIEWQEDHKLLKVDFPLDVHAEEAVSEIQFGYIKRPNHASRPYDADRFEVPQQKWTVLAQADGGSAVLNDCKYGVSVRGRTISLTLLKSALAPDQQADKGTQEFTYSLYPFIGSFENSDVVRKGYELNCPPTLHPGRGGHESLFSIGADSVVIDTIKPAADGSGDMIVRLFESMRKTVETALTTALPVTACEETDMLEGSPRAMEIDDGRIELSLRPFEIKTLRLKF